MGIGRKCVIVRRSKLDLDLLTRVLLEIRRQRPLLVDLDWQLLLVQDFWLSAPSTQFELKLLELLPFLFDPLAVAHILRGPAFSIPRGVATEVRAVLEGSTLEGPAVRRLLRALARIERSSSATGFLAPVSLSIGSPRRRIPAARLKLRWRMPGLAGASELGRSVRHIRRSGANAPQGGMRAVVSVWFATDRMQRKALTRNKVTFVGRRSMQVDPLSFGIAEVTIPSRHSEGRVERPHLWRLEFSEDPNKHFVVRSVELLSERQWALRARDTSSTGLVFVHGFNVSFDDAILQTAQMAYDLNFDGIPLCFSWPSSGKLSLTAYTTDEATVEWSSAHLLRFLRTVASELHLQEIHIVAHSMGNRALLNALAQWELCLGQGRAHLSQIVLAAPDVDAGIFAQLARHFGKTKRVTLYASSADKPLVLSRQVHGYPRAGDASPPVVLSGVDTVDVSAAGAEVFGLGHSHYLETSKVFADMFYVICHGGIPAERRVSIRLVKPGGYYELAI